MLAYPTFLVSLEHGCRRTLPRGTTILTLDGFCFNLDLRKCSLVARYIQSTEHNGKLFVPGLPLFYGYDWNGFYCIVCPIQMKQTNKRNLQSFSFIFDFGFLILFDDFSSLFTMVSKLFDAIIISSGS